MKKILWVVFIIVLFLSGSVYARELSQEEKTSIQNVIHKMIKIDASRIDSPAMGKVFASTFYNVKLTRALSSGSLGMGKLLLAKVGNNLIEPEGTQTGRSMPNLRSAIRQDFRLNSRKDAELLQQALDSVYKITSSSDVKAKAIIHKGDEWIFVRGKFFKKKKGFIFKVAGGVITEIHYSLGIIIDK
ncbi:MAG: hypothetical protein JRE58_10875 [Deltaproteobacteria bacterium]|nr:hypothetical protein [Deltaproteobacteria bacterium]